MQQIIKSALTIRLLQFFLPFILAAIGLLILYFVIDPLEIGKLLFLMMIYFIPPLGKESVIPIGISGGFLDVPFSEQTVYIQPIDPFIMAVAIAFVDIMVALFLVWNYDLVKKIPLIGDLVRRIERVGRGSSSKYSWIKPLEFIGIVLFVIVPFQGSGGFFGSVVGRLIGMKPWRVFIAIVIGSFMSTFLVAYFADIILSVLIRDFLLGLLILITISISIILILFYRKTKKT